MFADGNYCRMPIKSRQKNPNALKRVIAKRKKIPEIAVGFPSSKTKSIEYPTGESVIEVAAQNNFGVPGHIPRRPFMSLAKEPTLKKVRPIIKRGLIKVDENKETLENLAEGVGNIAVSQFKNTVVQLKTPPNSPRTIAEKKSDNPLVDTGLMVESLTFEIRKGKK